MIKISSACNLLNSHSSPIFTSGIHVTSHLRYEKSTPLYIDPFLPATSIATALQDRFYLTKLSIADIFREVLKEGGELTREMNQFLQQEKVVPTVLVEKIIADRFRTIVRNILLVGYPRTGEQFENFLALSEKESLGIERLWYVGLSDPGSAEALITQLQEKWMEKHGMAMTGKLDEKYAQLKNSVDGLRQYRKELWRFVPVHSNEIHDVELIIRRVNEAVDQ